MYRRGDDGHAGGGRGPRTMRGARPLGRGSLVLVLALVLILGLVGGAALGVLLHMPAATPAPSGPEYLFLTIGFDWATGLDRYMPANFTVPTHTPVVVQITNYDNTSNPVPGSVASVQGTVGNVEIMRSAADVAGMPMSSVPATQVAHTFTMTGGPYSINVPIAAARSLGNPMIVTFMAYFNVTGSFDWHCLAPCDASSMTTPGFMRGTVTVVET